MPTKDGVEIRNKGFFGRLFCKHEYARFRKTGGKFLCISGETRVRVCTKCGKQDGEYFAEYEGMGYK